MPPKKSWHNYSILGSVYGLCGKLETFGAAFLGLGCEPLFLFQLPDNQIFNDLMACTKWLPDNFVMNIPFKIEIQYEDKAGQQNINYRLSRLRAA